MGNREAISKMHNTSASVLTSVLTLIDEYDLYGQVACPKHHNHSELFLVRVQATGRGDVEELSTTGHAGTILPFSRDAGRRMRRRRRPSGGATIPCAAEVAVRGWQQRMRRYQERIMDTG